MSKGSADVPVSPLFLLYSREILAARQVLDLACGRGRHSLAAAKGKAVVVGLDRNRTHLRYLYSKAKHQKMNSKLFLVCGDLEADSQHILLEQTWDVVLVFRYLHRPLCNWIEQALRPGGLLLYETFTKEQVKFNTGPKNPDFLLEKGELPELFSTLESEYFEETISYDRGQALASLAARRVCNN